MAPSLKPAGKNRPVTPEDLLKPVLQQLSRHPIQQTLPTLRAVVPLLFSRHGPQTAHTLLAPILDPARGLDAALGWAALAEGVVDQAAPLAQAEAAARPLTDPDEQCRAWGAILRARSSTTTREAIWKAVERAGPAARRAVLDDFLALNDVDGMMRMMAILTPTAADQVRYTALLSALYRAGRISEVLSQLTRADIRVQADIFSALTEAPIQAHDVDGLFTILSACPSAYRSDLTEAALLQWVELGRIGEARKALQRWDADGSIVRRGMLAMLDDIDARTQLQATRDELLEIEEVAWHDTWRYRDLARACAWAGDLSGTLSALERVLDHEDRMTALLSAARYAPLIAREPLLCAAQGLAASMQDDRHRAEAVGKFGGLLVSLGRRRSGFARLEEASRLAIGVRRPRSDQGFARRAALESVIAAQLSADDLLGAFRTARKLRTKHMRNPYLSFIATRYAEMGDLGGAMCCIENMHPDATMAAAGAAALRAWKDAGEPVISTEAA